MVPRVGTCHRKGLRLAPLLTGSSYRKNLIPDEIPDELLKTRLSLSAHVSDLWLSAKLQGLELGHIADAGGTLRRPELQQDWPAA